MNKKIILLLLFVTAIITLGIFSIEHKDDVIDMSKLKVGNAQQVIVVTTEGANTSTAEINTFELQSDTWEKVLTVPGVIGKNGFTNELNEGDRSTPIGIFTLGTAFGRTDNPGFKLPYLQINDQDVWVNDPSSKDYNTWQVKDSQIGDRSAKKMDISAHDYGFVINYNTKRVPRKGSAVFFHTKVDDSTDRGVAIERDDLLKVLKWLDPNKNIVIVMAPKNQLYSLDRQPDRIEYSGSTPADLLLVNRSHRLAKNYVPPQLVTLPWNKKSIQLDRDAASALKLLCANAAKDGIKLFACSGYRPFKHQEAIYNYRVKRFGKLETDKYVAPPGASEHQSGLAVDLTSEDFVKTHVEALESSFGASSAGKWLAKNANKYGFIIRYPKGKESITGYNYEPWHLRFVGSAEQAIEIVKCGTLEEYLVRSKSQKSR